ncbi:MAG: hypothetical protein P8J79_03310 [Halioglobus sp.]|nr:hypothetical protein [Halioglobus sp.]
MKLTFLCGNHREWLQGRPDQAVHWCANSYDTGRLLAEREQWDEALMHMGCAFETAEIILTTRAVTPAMGLEWFMQTLEGLTHVLERLGRADAATEIRRAAIYRLRNEATVKITPEFEARIYLDIMRLNTQNRQRIAAPQASPPVSMRPERVLAEAVYH